jgi:hypothetical protein
MELGDMVIGLELKPKPFLGIYGIKISDTELMQTAVNYFDGAGWDVYDLDIFPLGDTENDWADHCWDFGSVGNISILVKQTENGNNNISLSMGTRVGKDDWGNYSSVATEYPGDAGSVQIHPKLGVGENRHFVVVWNIHHPDNDTVWYRGGQVQLNGSVTWDYAEVEWQTWEKTDTWEYTDLSSGMSEVLPVNVPLSMIYDDKTADEIFHDYIFPLGNGELQIPATHLNTTLYGPNGEPFIDGDYIFEGEVYTLESYVENATSFYLNTTDTRHDIRFNWDNSTSENWISVDPADQFTIGLAHSEFERTGNITRLLWRFIPDRSIIDAENSSWAYYIENEDMDYNTTGDLGFDTNIYNLGGLTYYTFTGDGNRTIGGQPFEIYATNGTEGSSARAEQIYRKLQSIHFLVEIDMDNEWDGVNGEFDIDPVVGFVDIGIDYRLNSTWVQGFYVRLYVQDANVGHHNLGNDHDWVEWSVDWYNYDPGTGTQQNFRSGLIYSNHWGYENENLTPDYHNRTSSQIWVDLWFDRSNASTTVAGQVNAMYHGMREHGSSWWFGYGDFQPMISDYGNALMLDDLYDEGGNITDSMKFDLMRVYLEVGKVADADGDDETWLIRSVENFNRKQAEDRMAGIEQPAFEETLVLDMPMFQSMNPLIRAIDGLSRSIWLGALGFQKILWGALDSFFAWAGFGEGFFSRITEFIMTLPDILITLMEFMPILLIEMAEIIESVFAAIVLMIPLYTISLGTMVETIIDYWQILSQMLNGQILPFDIIRDIQLGDWINFGITMLPTYEIFMIIFDNDPGRRAEERMSFYSKLFGGMINFLRGMVTLLQQIVQTIMEIIPG